MRALPTEAERRWVSGCNGHYESVLSAGAKVEERSDEIPPWRGKNCDEQLTHIVRIIRRFNLIQSYMSSRNFDEHIK